MESVALCVWLREGVAVVAFVMLVFALACLCVANRATGGWSGATTSMIIHVTFHTLAQQWVGGPVIHTDTERGCAWDALAVLICNTGTTEAV